MLGSVRVEEKKISCKIEIRKNNDIRSYNLDSTKLTKTGFKKNFSITNAIDEIRQAFDNKKMFKKSEWYSVDWLKKIKVI